MDTIQVSDLARWQNFYVIVGSSAGALTGLQFVVIALVAQKNAANSMTEISAFGTPNIFHFWSALMIAAVLNMPWSSLPAPGIILAVLGAVGVLYDIAVIRRARRAEYRPVMEDWIFFVILPLVGYASLLTSGILLESHPVKALFGIAAIALLLLFIGVRNAWDTVTYVAVVHNPAAAKKKE